MSTKINPPPPPPKEICTTTFLLPLSSSDSDDRSLAPAAMHCRAACCGLETGTGRYTTLSVLLGKEGGKDGDVPLRLPALSPFERRGEEEEEDAAERMSRREARARGSTSWRVGCPCVKSTPVVPLPPPSSSSCKTKESGKGVSPARERNADRSWMASVSSRTRNGVEGGAAAVGGGAEAAMMMERQGESGDVNQGRRISAVFSASGAPCRCGERA